MATVLAYTSPAIGHLFPMTPLLLELQRRGHEVHLRCLPDQVDRMRGLGFHVEPIDAQLLQVRHTDYQVRGAQKALEASVRTFCGRAPVDGPDLERAVAAVDPDLVLVDINAWGASDAAEAWGGPWALFSPYTPPLRSVGTPPFGPGLPPLAGPVGRLRDAVVGAVVVRATERVMRPRINEQRARYGLRPVSSADDYFRRAPLMLVTTAEPFEYRHDDWGDRVRMVGALSWDPPTERPAWLDDVDGPIVLVTTSSEYQGDEALVRTALEALRDEPCTVVATMPAGVADLGPVPPNARILDFVPHRHVLDKAVVAVTHGGMGATQKALGEGVPTCVVPFGRDQPEVAARVVHADAGTRLAPGKLTPQRLRDAVREARTKQPGAARVAAGYRAAGGAVAGVDAMEALLTPVSR